LEINLNCIGLLLTVREHFKDLENYDIPYDEDLYYMCYINNYFPDEYNDKFNIDKNVLKMRRFMDNKLNSDDKIITFIKDNNIKLDNYMLDTIMAHPWLKKLNHIVFVKNKCIPSPITMYKNINNNLWGNVNKFDKNSMLITHDVIF